VRGRVEVRRGAGVVVDGVDAMVSESRLGGMTLAGIDGCRLIGTLCTTAILTIASHRRIDDSIVIPGCSRQ
jgi:hypothetical protein